MAKLQLNSAQPFFSVEITERVLQFEVDFLATVDRFSQLKDPAVIRNAIRRYEQLWLPLAAEVGDDVARSLAPPIDVHWIWHCHMLAPNYYVADCQRIVGRTVDHVVRSPDDLVAARRRAVDMWNRKYPGEPFDLPSSPPIISSTSSEQQQQLSYVRRSTYDLEAAVGRQSKFYYNVSLPHYKDKRFLAVAVDRYRKFLYLKKSYRGAVLVPCYDVDLVWHTHQLHPVSYQRDTLQLLGRMFNHDDTMDDRSAGSAQQQAQAATRQLWLMTYREHYAMTGAMYRGICPSGMLAPFNTVRIVEPETKRNLLRLKAGPFMKCIMLGDIERLWSPIPVSRHLPPGVSNECWIATHKFLSAANGSPEYTCRIIHSLPLTLAAVQVLQADNLSVLSHLVGNEQLPGIHQLTSFKCPYLDVSVAERAMIIKDNLGDWGIVVGGWVGFRNGVPDDSTGVGCHLRRRRGVSSKPGHFTARFYPLRQAATAPKPVYQIKRLPTLLGSFQFNLLDVKVDLKRGTLRTSGSASGLPVDVAQKCCLALTVSTLYVLCQPRPPGPPRHVDSEVGKTRRTKSESLALVRAAGYTICTPSNSYYKSAVFGGACSGSCSGGSCGDV